MDERLKKVLVVYSTLSGCTTTIAKRIGVDLIAYDARPLVASVEEMPNIDVDVDAVVFGILILVLLVKPTGLLGKPVHEKV